MTWNPGPQASVAWCLAGLNVGFSTLANQSRLERFSIGWLTL